MTGPVRPRSPFTMTPGVYSLKSTHRFFWLLRTPREAAKRFAQSRSGLRGSGCDGAWGWVCVLGVSKEQGSGAAHVLYGPMPNTARWPPWDMLRSKPFIAIERTLCSEEPWKTWHGTPLNLVRVRVGVRVGLGL